VYIEERQVTTEEACISSTDDIGSHQQPIYFIQARQHPCFLKRYLIIIIIIIIIIMTRRKQRPVAMTLHGRGLVPSSTLSQCQWCPVADLVRPCVARTT